MVADGLERCRTCQIGEYQSEYAQNTCIVCPKEKSTVTRGASSVTECKGELQTGCLNTISEIKRSLFS